MDASQFRSNFPEFSDTTTYPDETVNRWLKMAGDVLDPKRWCDYYDLGVELYTAHWLSLGASNQRMASVGGIPGQVKGPLTSKAVDKVSVGYDSGAATIDGAGNWNLTSYGIQYYQLMLMVGSGGIQL